MLDRGRISVIRHQTASAGFAEGSTVEYQCHKNAVRSFPLNTNGTVNGTDLKCIDVSSAIFTRVIHTGGVLDLRAFYVEPVIM